MRLTSRWPGRAICPAIFLLAPSVAIEPRAVLGAVRATRGRVRPSTFEYLQSAVLVGAGRVMYDVFGRHKWIILLK